MPPEFMNLDALGFFLGAMTDTLTETYDVTSKTWCTSATEPIELTNKTLYSSYKLIVVDYTWTKPDD